MASSFPTERTETFSTAAIVAGVAAVLSLFLSPLWALLFAGIAGVAGAIGVFKAASPEVRGGFISLSAMGLGAIAVVIALFRAIF